MERKDNITIILVFATLILGFMVWGLLEADKEFSENENRYLQEKPVFSLGNVLDGTFEKNFENYTSDQFPLREKFIGLKTKACVSLNRKDIQGVYLGKDGYYIEKITEEKATQGNFYENINYIKDFYANLEEFIPKSKLSVMVVPTASLALKEKLPDNAQTFDEATRIEKSKKVLNKYNFIDVREALKAAKKRNQIYYKTDHHWTTRGALAAYQKWKGNNFQPNLTAATKSFRGTLYSKVLLADSAYDTIEIIEDVKNTKTMLDNNKGLIYDMSALEKKDKYGVFFGGNYGKVVIEGLGPKQEALLVIKDSFANSLIPFALRDYGKIIMIDPRYYNGNVSDVVKDEGITEALILYNTANLITDNNLVKLSNQKEVLQ